ncbi:Golgi apyrase [Tulasnella sp. UAMH 9824]|nr:Golgi apyrase [Tulasnella sp. UAMH 9824]
MPPPALSDPWLASRKFGIVIDAGSSGSRLQIYSWRDARAVRAKASPKALHALPTVEKGTLGAEDWQIKAEPGISSFGPNPEGVAKYLEPLIRHAKDQIPPSLHSSTPIFLLATAGMRLLPEEEQNAVLSAACDYIYSRSNFALDVNAKGKASGSPPGLERCGRSIRIISGEEEGLFGWIAVNYLMNGFPLTHKDHNKPTTFGFLDMGGASTQIAFEPIFDEDGTVQTPKENLADVHLRLLNGEEIRHQVFVTTWLGFGTNQARQRYVKEAIAEWERQHHLRLTGGSDDHSGVAPHHAKHAGSTMVSSIDIKDPCLPKDLELHDTHLDMHSEATPVKLIGTGSFSQCLSKTTPLLNKTATCDQAPCLFGGVHVPPIDFKHHRFIGISEYWYSSQHVFGLGGAFDFEKYEKAAEEFCGKDWDAILKKHHEAASPDASITWGHRIDKSRLELQCFKSAWIVNVLGDGVGIPRTSEGWLEADAHVKDTPHVDEHKAEELGLDKGKISNPVFQSVDTIKGTAVSWTLGKMVLEASKGVPASSKNAKPLADPMGPKPNIENTVSRPMFGISFDVIEGNLPAPLRRESLGFSPVLLLFYVLVLMVLYSLSTRMRNRFKNSFRRWRRATVGRKDKLDTFVEEDGLAGSSSGSSSPTSRPETPGPFAASAQLYSHPSGFGSSVVSAVVSTINRIPFLSTSRRISPNGSSYPISTSRPRPKHSLSMPTPASPSWATATLSVPPVNGGTPRLSSDERGESVPTPPNGLNPNGLALLSSSRNSSQINLARTFATPRNVSGLSTPLPLSGYRTPATYDDV